MADNGKITVSRNLVIILGVAAVWYMRKDRYRKGYDKGYAAGRKSITDKVFKEEHDEAFVMDTDEGSFKVSEIKKKERKPLIEVDKPETGDTNETNEE